MGVDLNTLNLTQEVVDVDFDQYKDATEFPPPAPEGVYMLIPAFQDENKQFDATGAGYLQTTLKHTISAPGTPEDGHVISFDRLSNKPFERQGVKVSIMADQLRAWGVTERPKTHGEYAIAIEAQVRAGTPFKAQTQWEAGCNHEGTLEVCEWGDKSVFRIKGMKRFPQDVNGSHIAEIPCPVCGSVVRARERISRRIPA